MSQQHTPGPWSASSDDKLNPERAYGITVPWNDGDERGTVVIAEITHADSAERAKADARLIAAAPDLLAACRAALACPEMNWQEMDDVSRAAVNAARAAIAKAEGREG